MIITSGEGEKSALVLYSVKDETYLVSMIKDGLIACGVVVYCWPITRYGHGGRNIMLITARFIGEKKRRLCSISPVTRLKANQRQLLSFVAYVFEFNGGIRYIAMFYVGCFVGEMRREQLVIFDSIYDLIARY